MLREHLRTQVFLRTTYFEAFERLARDLPLPPDEAIKEAKPNQAQAEDLCVAMR